MRIIRESQIDALPEPGESELGYMRTIVTQPRKGYVPLSGPDAEIWKQEKFDPDLVALGKRHRLDPFSRCLSRLIRPLVVKIVPYVSPRYQGSVIYYDLLFERIASIITGVVGSLLPIAAILALYSVGSMPLRLVLTAVFSGIFSLALYLLTDARRTDIFVGTAA